MMYHIYRCSYLTGDLDKESPLMRNEFRRPKEACLMVIMLLPPKTP